MIGITNNLIAWTIKITNRLSMKIINWYFTFVKVDSIMLIIHSYAHSTWVNAAYKNYMFQINVFNQKYIKRYKIFSRTMQKCIYQSSTIFITLTKTEKCQKKNYSLKIFSDRRISTTETISYIIKNI